MAGQTTRRRLLQSGGALSLGILGASGIAAGADCEATLDTNAETEAGDRKLEVPSEEGVEISGSSTCDPGSELSVTIRSEDSSSPFLSRPVGTVDEDGTFSVTADLHHLDTGTPITLEISHDDDSVSPTYEGEVVENPPTPTPSPTPTNTPTATPTRTETPTATTETDPDTESTSTSGEADPTSTGDGGETRSTTTDGSGPGFGVVSLLGGAVCALGTKVARDE